MKKAIVLATLITMGALAEKLESRPRMRCDTLGWSRPARVAV